MKNKAWLAGLFLILALLACSLPNQGTETPAVEETTIAHSTEVIPTEDETEIATESAVATEAPEQPLPMVYGMGEELVVLDPITGVEINRLAAPSFGIGGKGGVSGNGVFYIDYDYLNAYRVGFDGVLQELLFLNADGGYFEGLIYPSTDGLQVAQGAVMSFDASGSHVQLRVFNVDGTDERILVDATLTEQPLRPTAVKWSQDGEYLYYMNVIEGIEGYGGLDLIKVNVNTSASETIFPAAGSLMSTSVSPNEAYAARAVSGDLLGIVVRDLATGIDQTVTLPEKYRQAWQMVWAPDDSAVLVTVGLGMWESDTYSVIRIDPVTLETTFLVMDDPNLLSAVAWQALETIWFVDRDSTLWKMDSGDLTLTMVATNAQIVGISR